MRARARPFNVIVLAATLLVSSCQPAPKPSTPPTAALQPVTSPWDTVTIIAHSPPPDPHAFSILMESQDMEAGQYQMADAVVRQLARSKAGQLYFNGTAARHLVLSARGPDGDELAKVMLQALEDSAAWSGMASISIQRPGIGDMSTELKNQEDLQNFLLTLKLNQQEIEKEKRALPPSRH